MSNINYLSTNLSNILLDKLSTNIAPIDANSGFTKYSKKVIIPINTEYIIFPL